MATLCGKFSAGLRSLNRLNAPLFSRVHQAKCSATVKDGCMQVLQRRMAGGKPKKFFIQAPQHSEMAMMRKFLRYLGYTGVPLILFATGVNVFIGPAQFKEIPEGYEPKYWEYYEHPISRWLVRYTKGNPQRDYEKMCHFMELEQSKKEAREELQEVKKVMKERGDGVWSFNNALSDSNTSMYRKEANQ